MLTEKHIRTLWLRMGEMYGALWTSSHGDFDQNNTWLKGLTGISPQQIANGLNKCLQTIGESKGPPTLPIFRAMCLDLPNKQAAISAAINQGYTNNQFVLAMRRRIGAWNLRTKTTYELQRIAENVFHDLISEAMTTGKSFARLESNNNGISISKESES